MEIRLNVDELLESIAVLGLVAFTLGMAFAAAVQRYRGGLLSIRSAVVGRPVSTLSHDLARFVEAVERALGTFFRSTSNWRWRL
jgi:hypothetical protein